MPSKQWSRSNTKNIPRLIVEFFSIESCKALHSYHRHFNLGYMKLTRKQSKFYNKESLLSRLKTPILNV